METRRYPTHTIEDLTISGQEIQLTLGELDNQSGVLTQEVTADFYTAGKRSPFDTKTGLRLTFDPGEKQAIAFSIPRLPHYELPITGSGTLVQLTHNNEIITTPSQKITELLQITNTHMLAWVACPEDRNGFQVLRFFQREPIMRTLGFQTLNPKHPLPEKLQAKINELAHTS